MPDPPLPHADSTPDAREVLLGRLLTQRDVLLDEAFRIILAADALEDHRADGALTMADWLTYRYRIDPDTARSWVRAAHKLQDLPHLRARFVAGELSFDQLRAALRFATPTDDEHLAALLPSLSCTQIQMLATQRRRARRTDHDQARRRTHLRLRPDRDRTGVRVSGYLPNEDAAIIGAALDRRAEAAGPDAETSAWAPHDERVAGALRDLCAHDLSAAATDGSEPDTAMVIIHAPAELLHHDTLERSATINGAPIPVDVLRRYLCDTRIEIHHDTPQGITIGIGRATRNPPAWLRRRVIGRDHHRCRWPGCSRAIRHLHHLQHWTHGGATDAANLMGVCWHHHHLLHEGGWNATGNADHTITLTNPYGRTIHTRAGPMAA